MSRRRIEWTPLVVLGLSLLILVLFIVYPLSRVVLNSFLLKGKPFSLANLTLATAPSRHRTFRTGGVVEAQHHQSPVHSV